MSDPLASARLKLVRAYEHAEALYRERRRFSRSRPYRVITETDPDTGEHLAYAVLERDPDDELALILGDLIHNLRAGLDHAVFGLVRFYLGRPMTDGELRSTEFPIYRDSLAFGLRGKRAIRFLPESMRELIEREQPYNAPETVSVLDHPPAILQDLWNADKHRTLLVTSGFANLYAGPALRTPEATKGHRFTDPIVENGSVVSRLPASVAADPEQELQPHIAVQVTLKQGGPAWGPGVSTTPIDWLVKGLDRYVDRVVDDLDDLHIAGCRHRATS